MQVNNQKYKPINTTQEKTFANVASTNSSKYPNKNQAIIVNPIEAIPIEDYIYKIGDIVGEENITHICKLSNNRLCIFLATKELIDKFIQEHSTIKINDILVEVRRYVNSAQRVILSNVCPSIPDILIENEMNKCGVKIVSSITHLKYSLSLKKTYWHILSSRRQVFIPPDMETKLPAHINVVFEDTDYKIYLALDTTCFACKQKGHIASKCPTKEQPINNTDMKNTATSHNDDIHSADIVNIENTVNRDNSIPNEATNTDETTNEITTNKEINKTSKRAAQSISSLEDDGISETQDDNVEEINNESINNNSGPTSQKNKKIKKPKRSTSNRSLSPASDSSISLEEVLEPIKTQMESYPALYPVSFSVVNDFLQEAQHSTEYLQIAEKFTKDKSGLLLTLKEVQQYLSCRSSKNQITRITNKYRESINKHVAQNPTNKSPPH